MVMPSVHTTLTLILNFYAEYKLSLVPLTPKAHSQLFIMVPMMQIVNVPAWGVYTYARILSSNG